MGGKVPRAITGRVKGRVWIPLLCIIAALAPNAWFLPSLLGYAISGLVLAGSGAYVLFRSNVNIRLDVLFLALLGGYWLMLTAGWFVDRSPARLEYIVVTPLSVGVTVFLLPAIIDRYRGSIVDRHRGEFVAMVAVLGAIVASIGFAMLFFERTIEGLSFPWTGSYVFGVYGYRTSSIFVNPNTHGFFMMVCTISAIFNVLERGFSPPRLGAVFLCGAALLTSDSSAAILGTGVGLVLLAALFHRLITVALLTGGALGLVTLFDVGLIERLVNTPSHDTLLSGRDSLWRASVERLSKDPLVGIGFMNYASEIAPFLPEDGPAGYGPHNSYVNIFLQAGIIAGTFYLAAIFYAFSRTLCNGLSRWSVYVLSVLGAILVASVFETMTLGGLSLNSIVFGMYLGLALSLGRSRVVVLRPGKCTT